MQDPNATPNNTEQVSAPVPSPITPSAPTMTIDPPKKKNSPVIAIIAAVAVVAIAIVCLFAFMPAKDKDDKDNTDKKPADVIVDDTNKAKDLEPITFKFSKTSIVLYGTFGETIKTLSNQYHIIRYVSDGGAQGHDEDIKDIDSYLEKSPDDVFETLYLGYSENRPSLGVELYPAFVENVKTLAESPYGIAVDVNYWGDDGSVYFDDIGPFKKNMTAEDVENLSIKFTKQESKDKDETKYTAEYKNRLFTISLYDHDDFLNADSETVVRIDYKHE